jgi:hypothetical protein
MIKKYISSLIQSIFNSDMYRYGEDRWLLSRKENTAYHVKQAYRTPDIYLLPIYDYLAI